MKPSTLIRLGWFGISTILFRRKKAILGTIILTDRCNLHCRHCSVNNLTSVIYPYSAIREEMLLLYRQGIRILFFCGGETFLWEDSGRTLRDLVTEARKIGFLIVNVVTNGTYPLDLPEADLILLSLDGDEARHNAIRGDTYRTILENVAPRILRQPLLLYGDQSDQQGFYPGGLRDGAGTEHGAGCFLQLPYPLPGHSRTRAFPGGKTRLLRRASDSDGGRVSHL